MSARSLTVTLTPGTLRLKRLKDRTAQHTQKQNGGKVFYFVIMEKSGFKYMTATLETMHGVKLKIEKQGMKCHLGQPDQTRSYLYKRSHAAHLTDGSLKILRVYWLVEI